MNKDNNLDHEFLELRPSDEAERTFMGGQPLRARRRLFLLSGLLGFLNLKAQLYTGYFVDTTSIPFINNVISAGYVLTNYIFKLFFPLHLSPHYPYPFDLTASVPKIYYLFTLIFPVVLAIIYFFRKNKTILLGLLFYLTNIFLMIRFIPVAENVMPDRYNYLPIIGFAIIIYYLLEKQVRLVGLLSF